MIFSDESTFEVQLAQPRLVRRGAEPVSSLHMAQSHKWPQKVMIWGCMSHHGFGRIHVVTGMMNSQQYIDVLRSRLIPQAAEWYPDNWVFQQDNAPCHTSKAVKRVMTDEGLVVLPWPSNSPDMNPIETLWAVLKNKLRQKTIASRQALINEILNIGVRDNEVSRQLTETARKLVAGMPDRIRALIEAKGGHTTF